MKTSFFYRMILAAGLFFLFTGQQAQAQVNCPYSITNNMNCPVKISINMYDQNCLICYTQFIGLNPGDVYMIPCSDFCWIPACDLDVNVLDVNGTPIAGCTVNMANPSMMIPGTPCSGGDNINWTPNQTDINP
jgi:hypothetical protein